MKEQHNMTGKVRIVLKDGSGRLIKENRVNNLIVNSGRLMMANLFAGLSNDTVTYMAIGTGDEESTAQMVELVSECAPLGADPGRSLLSGQDTIAEDNGDYTITVSAAFDGDTYTAGPDIEVREAGLFTGETGGVMYNRVVFDPVPLRPEYEITLSWDVTFPGPS